MIYNNKQPDNNLCVSSMKLKLSAKDLLCYSEWICVDFKLNKPTLQELWTPSNGLHERGKDKLEEMSTATYNNTRYWRLAHPMALCYSLKDSP